VGGISDSDDEGVDAVLDVVKYRCKLYWQDCVERVVQST
jgi:hypothetical protein